MMKDHHTDLCKDLRPNFLTILAWANTVYKASLGIFQFNSKIYAWLPAPQATHQAQSVSKNFPAGVPRTA